MVNSQPLRQMEYTIIVLKEIHTINNYEIIALFSNGEYRKIDFLKLFKKWKITEKDFEYKIKSSIEEFKKVKIIDGVFTWENIQIKSTDEFDKTVFLPYDIAPETIYNESALVKDIPLKMGLQIKFLREEKGISQKTLSLKSSISQSLISQIENEKTKVSSSTYDKLINKLKEY